MMKKDKKDLNLIVWQYAIYYRPYSKKINHYIVKINEIPDPNNPISIKNYLLRKGYPRFHYDREERKWFPCTYLVMNTSLKKKIFPPNRPNGTKRYAVNWGRLDNNKLEEDLKKHGFV